VSLRAISYGLAAFFGAYALMTLVANVMVDAGVYGDGSGLIQVMGYLVPVVAGYVAARKAAHWRIVHGLVGGSIGIVPMQLTPMLVDPDHTPDGMLVILICFAVLAALGAVFGDHVAKKRAGR